MVNHDEQEILRLTNLLLQASVQQDAATLNQIIADEFIITGSGSVWGTHGKFGSKASTIARWTSPLPPEITPGSATLSEERITISGDTAVLFGLITDRWSETEGEHILQSWVSDVWVKHDQGWRLLSSHETIFLEQ